MINKNCPELLIIDTYNQYARSVKEYNCSYGESHMFGPVVEFSCNNCKKKGVEINGL